MSPNCLCISTELNSATLNKIMLIAVKFRQLLEYKQPYHGYTITPNYILLHEHKQSNFTLLYNYNTATPLENLRMKQQSNQCIYRGNNSYLLHRYWTLENGEETPNSQICITSLKQLPQRYKYGNLSIQKKKSINDILLFQCNLKFSPLFGTKLSLLDQLERNFTYNIKTLTIESIPFAFPKKNNYKDFFMNLIQLCDFEI